MAPPAVMRFEAGQFWRLICCGRICEAHVRSVDQTSATLDVRWFDETGGRVVTNEFRRIYRDEAASIFAAENWTLILMETTR